MLRQLNASVSAPPSAGPSAAPIVAQTDNAAFVRTDVPRLPGLARLTRGESASSTLAIRVEPDVLGPHVVVLGGRMLAARAPRIQLDGHSHAWRDATMDPPARATGESKLAAPEYKVEIIVVAACD